MLMVKDVDLTPNPQALKFILNERILNRETRSFESKEEAEKDPLAKAIFELEGVVSVFYMDKFITIEKEPDVSWGKIQMPFVNLIKSFDKTLIPEEDKNSTTNKNESEKLKQINELLDKSVRPALAGDGGGLDVLDFKDNILTIRYQGACGTCPSAISGTMVAIKNIINREIDPTIEVKHG
jgi:Fe-S cluster biogenesis protein NfuA